MTYAGIASAGASSPQTQISSQTLASSSTTIQFSAIPQTYKHLLLEMFTLTTGSNKQFVRLQKNNSSAGHSWMYQEFPISTGSVSVTNGSNQGYFQVGPAPGSNTIPGYLRVVIPNYSVAGNHFFSSQGFSYEPSASNTPNAVASGWQGTAIAVTVLNISLSANSFATGTIATLYGLA